jgi:rhodanese-related sulfurtransferase
VDGALHIPFSDLPGRLTDIPEGEIWVYCRTGYRAVVAASILAAAGRQVVSIDDEFDHAHDAGLTLMRPGRELQERPR